MNVAEFLTATGLTLSDLARLARVSYGTLHAHHKHGKALGLKVARKLESVVVEGNDARISAARLLGLDDSAKKTTATKRKAA